MKKGFKSCKRELIIFLLWRGCLLLVALLAISIVPKFGETFPYANTVLIPTGLPSWIWGFGNFDGVHYLRLAQNGYQDAFYQAFFPLYPLLIRFLNIFPKDVTLNRSIFVDKSYFYTAFLLSNLFVLIFLFIYQHLSGAKDYFLDILFLLAFPTAFYLGAIYTESLFLLCLTMYLIFLRKKNFLFVGITIIFASLTRVIGILLVIPLMIILWKEKRFNFRAIFSLLLAPLGFLGYLWYLWSTTGNPLFFLTSQPGFGAGRSSLPIITLPQVFYRYSKMFLTVKEPMQYFVVANEFGFSILILILLIWSFKKVSWDRWWLALLFYITPTLTGTLSSMPRYVLFSYFLLIPSLRLFSAKTRNVLVLTMIVYQLLLVVLFTRGYWVA